MNKWTKDNLVASLSLSFILLSTISSVVYNYSSLSSEIENVRTSINEIRKEVDGHDLDMKEQSEIEKRLSLLESNSVTKFKKISQLDENFGFLQKETQDFKAQSAIVNNTVLTLNVTLDKMNNTLDKLNETVIIVGKDVSYLKKEVEELKEEVNK